MSFLLFRSRCRLYWSDIDIVAVVPTYTMSFLLFITTIIHISTLIMTTVSAHGCFFVRLFLVVRCIISTRIKRTVQFSERMKIKYEKFVLFSIHWRCYQAVIPRMTALGSNGGIEEWESAVNGYPNRRDGRRAPAGIFYFILPLTIG